MKCGVCETRMRCIDSRPTGDRKHRRRYVCDHCGARQSSIEIPIDETAPGRAMIGEVYNHDVLRRIIDMCEGAIKANEGL